MYMATSFISLCFLFLGCESEILLRFQPLYHVMTWSTAHAPGGVRLPVCVQPWCVLTQPVVQFFLVELSPVIIDQHSVHSLVIPALFYWAIGWVRLEETVQLYNKFNDVSPQLDGYSGISIS